MLSTSNSKKHASFLRVHTIFTPWKEKMMMKIENDKREGQVFLCCTHVSLMKDAYDDENDDAHSIGRQPQSIGEVY